MNQSNQEITKQFALFNFGFRPFFLGAGIFVVASIVLWMIVYFSNGFVNIEHGIARLFNLHPQDFYILVTYR